MCCESTYPVLQNQASSVKKFFFNVHHYVACLKTHYKNEAFVPVHQLTVPEQKSCNKDINANPFLILCGKFP
jgi:hypothetical protein